MIGKKLIKLVLAIVVLGLALPMGVTAADKQVVWQVWVTPNLNRAFYEDVVKAFQAKNPGITVKIVEANAGNDSTADNYLKLHLAAGDAPDVWQNFDIPGFADAGMLWEIPANDPDLKKVVDLQAASYKGKLYAFNNSIQPQGCIYYNKTLWKKAGLTTLPKSWAEFEAACAKIKAAGLVPLITGGEWVAGWDVNMFVSVNLGKNNPNWWTDKYAGKTSFAKTADVTESLDFFTRLVDKGYFNKGAVSTGYADLEQQFLAGKAVMYPMGSWFTAAEAKATKDFDVGVFTFPTKDGKTNMVRTAVYGSSPAVYSKSKVTAEAFKLVKFFVMDPVYGAKFLEADGLYSNLNPPLTYTMSPLQKELGDVVQKAQFRSANLQHMLGSAGAPGIFDKFSSIGQLILASGSASGKKSVDYAMELDDFVASIK